MFRRHVLDEVFVVLGSLFLVLIVLSHVKNTLITAVIFYSPDG